MSYSVKQPNPFGQFGQGFGQGLAEQLPKEIERSRLASGLEELGQQKGLSPFQQYAAMAGLPGITPQMLQGGSDLLRQQAMMQGYRNANQQYRNQNAQDQQLTGQTQGQQPNLNQVVFGQQPGQPQRQSPFATSKQEQVIPQVTGNREEQIKAAPPAASENPLDKKYVPPPAWNQHMRDRAINEGLDRGFNLPEAEKYADQQERYYNNAPEAERAAYEYKRGVDQRVNDLFDSQLATRLQKEGRETYSDISGDLQLDLKQQAKNAVATGRMTPEESAAYYTKAALDLGKQKSEFAKLSNPTIDEYFVPSKKSDRIKSFMTMGHEFAKYGPAAQEEFYKMLINSETGPGLSPGGAALLAYPRSKEVKGIINDSKVRSGGVQERTQQSVRIADDILSNMKSNDSLLAIVRELQTKFPSFDERAFFDYMNENRDRWPNNPNFVREMEEGISNVLPSWGDMGLFPSYGLSPAHK